MKLLAVPFFLFLLVPVFTWGKPELRGFWADAWHNGFRSPGQVDQLIADVRAANCNALFVQVRLRGDTFYESRFEPKTAHVAADYDPLADLISKARESNQADEPVEIHAWIVVGPLWPVRGNPPPQADHVLRRHPEWLTRNFEDKTSDADSRNFMLDPGHPGVQEHIFNIAMELVENYGIDGLHLDHIRYLDRSWGYNETSLERFRRLHEREDRPAPDDPDWMQFRRDQVTALVRKIYLNVLDRKPHVKVSAAVNTRAPGITATHQWQTSAAYKSTLQDWHAWMKEGIIDLATPMTYMDMDGRWAVAWERWSTFAKDHRYNRHVAIGSGIYLNTIENGIHQIRSTREPTAKGNRADGVVLYSYAVTNKEGLPRPAFISAVSQRSEYDSNPEPVFAGYVPPPEMPWKTDPIHGHLKGRVITESGGEPVDGAIIRIQGPENREVMTGATGFFGAVDLPPGEYEVSTGGSPGIGVGAVTIAAGKVSTVNLLVD